MLLLKLLKRLIKSKTGFTLTELLAAIAIVALFTTAFLTLFTKSSEMIYRSSKKSQSVLKGQQEMEQNMAGRSVDANSAMDLMLYYGENYENHVLVKGGLASVTTSVSNEITSLTSFMPSPPMINVYLATNASLTIPTQPFILQEKWNETTLYVDCLNFDASSCQVNVEYEGDDLPASNYNFSPRSSMSGQYSFTLANYSMTNLPPLGTYFIRLTDASNNIDAKGVFTVTIVVPSPSPSVDSSIAPSITPAP